jgi:tetratricopeptide (TPR) repeat protein
MSLVFRYRAKAAVIKFIPLVALVLAGLLFNELRAGPDPDTFIFRKETVSSWIPFVEKYFIYDKDGRRYKVNREVYDSYRLWSAAEKIYANDRMAQAAKDMNEQKEKEALEARKKQIEKSDVETAMMLTHLGQGYFNKGSYDEAIDNFNKAVLVNPKCVEAYAMRGISYFYKDDYDKCWADVDKAQGLGYKFDSDILEKLKMVSGRSPKNNVKDTSQAEKTDITLDGIFSDAGGRYKAMINGRPISEGGSIGSVKIDKINKNSIDITADGQKKNIKVGERYE